MAGVPRRRLGRRVDGKGRDARELAAAALGVGFATEESYHHGYARQANVEVAEEVLAFALASEEYGLDIVRIREIIKPRATTEVPRAPAFVPGIISVRGQIIPVVDLRLRLRLPVAPTGKDTRILIVTQGDDVYGLIVDRVHQVVRMRAEEIEPPPAMLGGGEAEFIAGIGRPEGERMLILVNLDAVLAFGPSKKKEAAG